MPRPATRRDAERARGGPLDSSDAFRLFVESVHDYAIFMLDRDGYIVSWNQGAQRIKGYAPGEIIGSHFSRFYSPQDIQDGKPQRELAIASAEGRVVDEGWRIRSDGSRFWAHVVITAVRDTDGTLIGFGKVTRDVTAMHAHAEENRRLAAQLQEQARRLEEDVRARTADLQRANAELQSANTALQTFAHSLAHDLRGPLRTIQGFAEILLEDHSARLDEEGRDFLERVARASARLNVLVQNLLVYARVAHPGQPGTLEPVSWDRVIDTALRDIASDGASAGARIDVRRPLGTVLAQSETLASVAHNLLSNALKFVAPGTAPYVRISSATSGSRVKLKIRDNGVGVPIGEQERIFEPFERLHGHAVYGGTGLGLAIVAEAVRRMGGSFGVESDGGEGSCFWVELPGAPEGRHADGGADSTG